MGGIIQRLKDWWQAADRTQRLVTIFGVAFLVLILGFTGFFASRPKMQPVFVGLSQEDASAVYDELSKRGFRVDLSPQGDVEVPAQDLPRAKMALASANKMPKSGGTSMDLINSIGPMDSQGKEKEKLLAATEQKLERSISTMDSVRGVQVHLSLGKDSPFGDQTTLPSASIRITESNDGALSMESGKAISRLVQNAITGLQSKSITVLTDSGRIVFDGMEEDSPMLLSNRKMEAEHTEGRLRTTELQNELDRIYGKGNTIVDIDVLLNMDATNIKKDETLRTGEAINEETAKEVMSSTKSGSGPAAGTQSNIPGTPTTADPTQSSGNDYTSEVESKTYPFSTTQTQIEKAAGEIIAMNISITANTASIEDLSALEERAQAYVAPWKANPKIAGQFNSTVTGVDFFANEAEAEAKAASAAANAARMQQLISLLPVGALVAVALLLMRSIGKTFKSTAQTLVLSNGDRVNIPVGADPELVKLLQEADAASAAQAKIANAKSDLAAAGVTDGEDDEEEEEYEDLDDEGEVVVKKRKKKRRIEEDDDEDDMDVSSIKRRVDIPLEQIKKMTKKNPEAVAMLLKSWVMEDLG
ncbi:MAG: hypothetical protein KDC26_00280 [Armatimonadetes bacterium]|nr:hypothetical protein [Armatimonadota bacterium]